MITKEERIKETTKKWKSYMGMIDPSYWNRMWCAVCLHHKPVNKHKLMFWHIAYDVPGVVFGSGCPGSRHPGYQTIEDAQDNYIENRI